MSTAQLPLYANAVNADSAATAGALVLRDGSGGAVFVQAAASELKSTGLLTVTRVLKTVAFTLDATATLFSCDATAAAFAATLPAATTCPGRVYIVKKIDASANAVTVTGNGAETIDGANTKVLSSQWSKVMLISNGVSWEIVV